MFELPVDTLKLGINSEVAYSMPCVHLLLLNISKICDSKWIRLIWTEPSFYKPLLDYPFLWKQFCSCNQFRHRNCTCNWKRLSVQDWGSHKWRVICITELKQSTLNYLHVNYPSLPHARISGELFSWLSKWETLSHPVKSAR